MRRRSRGARYRLRRGHRRLRRGGLVLRAQPSLHAFRGDAGEDDRGRMRLHAGARRHLRAARRRRLRAVFRGHPARRPLRESLRERGPDDPRKPQHHLRPGETRRGLRARPGGQPSLHPRGRAQPPAHLLPQRHHRRRDHFHAACSRTRAAQRPHPGTHLHGRHPGRAGGSPGQRWGYDEEQSGGARRSGCCDAKRDQH